VQALGDSRQAILIVLFAFYVSGMPVRAADVEVQALFTHAAMLKIEGQSKMLKVGKSFGGVTLLEANSREAIIEIAGKRQTVTVSQRISGNYEQPKQREVRITRDSRMQYLSQAEINGRGVKVLVDTGANVVAMNSIQAQSLGINYRSGTPSRVETAGGVVAAWIVTLDAVDVGGIVVNGVQASVIEGTHPVTILLGMTYLKHVEMQEKNGILLLSRSY
jgi:aspartyl protease family protein